MLLEYYAVSFLNICVYMNERRLTSHRTCCAVLVM